MTIKFKAALLVVVFIIAGCANKPIVEQKTVNQCEDPRPQMCTMDYTPVCGLVGDEVVKTYGNACSACGDTQVEHYVADECQSDSLEQFSKVI